MSYTDPEVLYGRLASGDAGRVAAAADPITGARSAVGRAGDSVTAGGSTAGSTWQGGSADRFRARAELSTKAAAVAGERLAAGSDIVQAASRAYAQMRGSADQLIDFWRGRSPALDEAQTRDLANRVNAQLDNVKSGYENVLRSYAGALAKVRPGFEETAGRDAGWGTAVATMRTTAAVPGPGTDPKQVAAWWKSLTKEQQDELLRTKFQELGQLRGLPSGVLDQANRMRIDDDVQRFGAQRDQLDAQMQERARELGLDPDDSGDMTRLLNDPRYASLRDQWQEASTKAENAQKAQGSIEQAEGLAKQKGWQESDVRVLAYDPYGPRGDGGIAVAFGDPDTAGNLAVCVPGTGSDMGSFGLDQAANLREQMGPNGNATIQWLGYDAPGWAIGEVDNPAQAREGGANLVADVNGYRAAAEAAGNRQHLTVIGHSYGSTTVGYAGMNGLAADDIAFIGSPGVGASNVDQLSVGPGHVYVGATEHDPVVQGTSNSWFTEDGSSIGPYDDRFGAKVFGTTDSSMIGHAHSAYYDEGTESVQNLARIATGDGGSVTGQKWYDDPLGPSLPGSHIPVVGPVVDVVSGTVAGAADLVGDAGTGLYNAGREAWNGNWSEAGTGLLDTGKEIVSDGLDVVVGGVGDVVEFGRDAVEGVGSAWDKTVGSWF
ncbi:alpha/beta hydrolase [Saccharothrix longispora]|uniref:alpha/beta hydrolase n=1 Tax=Saccharothrix longispora TaxID=33920 RepID=UPI0028FD4AFC|nr:alpha/beta hydrolase [Saccharothrix longispora]MBY8847596.1 alpha/beta hydrolase family protein [Saccharothrix sp. MB29]MDU0289661.1 alpha/beta hydrolase [Saccharothrix longispora]